MTRESLTKVFGTEFIDSKDNFKARCPYHQERTPSFYVHKEEYIAHCFGCDVSGSIDQLAASYLGCEISEARTRLQITISERVLRRVEANQRTRDKEQTVSRIPESWLAPFKKEVHKYVLDRGFEIQTLRSIECAYDGVTKRQVFPHRNRDGELVGAVGRACAEQDPKWKFYWNYDKGQTLYSPERVRGERKLWSEGPLILVEGVFDVLWLRQHGYRNAVAPIGATATKYQLSEVKELGEDVILGFDNDQSGQEGNRRVYEAIRSDCRCWFLEWPEHAKDWMDLDKDGIDNIINTRRTPFQHALRGGVIKSSRNSKKFTVTEKR